MAVAWFSTFLLKAFVRRVDWPDGPTVMRTLDAGFDRWRRARGGELRCKGDRRCSAKLITQNVATIVSSRSRRRAVSITLLLRLCLTSSPFDSFCPLPSFARTSPTRSSRHRPRSTKTSATSGRRTTVSRSTRRPTRRRRTSTASSSPSPIASPFCRRRWRAGIRGVADVHRQRRPGPRWGRR